MFKELAEHCRTTHLALIALCFALLVAGTSGIDSPEMLAHKELLAVSKIAERLRSTWWDTAIREKFATAFSGDLNKNYRVSDLLLKDSSGNILRLPIAHTWFLTRTTANSGESGPADVAPSDIPNFILGQQAIKTLDDFARTWTLLSSHSTLVVLEITLGGIRISPEGSSELTVPIDQSDSQLTMLSKRVPSAALLSRAGAIRAIDAALKGYSIFGNTDNIARHFDAAKQYLNTNVSKDGCVLLSISPGAIIVVQSDCESRTPQLQKDLVSNITPNPPTGTYQNSFPNLAKATVWIDQSPIDKLEKHLYDRAFTTAEKVDVFGTKISESALASWGLTVLGSVYAWFIIHLFKLGSFSRASVSKAEPYAWIGLFDDLASRLAFVLTAFVLPCGTAFVLIWMRLHALESSVYSWDIVLALVTTFALSVVAIRTIGRLWRVNWTQFFARKQ